MPVRQMKLHFNAKPITRVVPSRLEPPRGRVERGNKNASGETLAKPALGVPETEAPPPAGSG
jgi:hypothetical protein